KGVIYKLDPTDGTILHTIQAPSDCPRGLAFDGKSLWSIDNCSDEIVQFDPSDGTTIRSFPSPAHDPQGIAWDGKYLWVCDRAMNELYMVDPQSGCVIIITDSPGPFPLGLGFDGKNLWNGDYQLKKIYKLKVRDGELFRRTNEMVSKVTYTHLATNFGPGKVKTLDIHFAVGSPRDNQEIVKETKYLPAVTDFKTDKWGQKTAHWHVENIAAGQKNEVQATTVIKTWDVRYFIYPEQCGSLDDIPGEIRGVLLADNDKYNLNNPVIQSAVKKIVGNEKNPYWIARKIYNYLIDNMYYEMVGGWNTAPTVLERGNGSCSEYTFVYIALCRAAGLPARYVGSVAQRGEKSAMDDVFHRWAEVYLPGFGWIPVDPSGGDEALPRGQADSFGALSNRFFITTQSSGGSETLQWNYNSNTFWTTEPQTYIVTEYFADWEPGESN
ncbi:MAG: transglutaminase, partial [Bacteroidetes bacterium]|nr:transglutaminase [Bacteroidota bacterium]